MKIIGYLNFILIVLLVSPSSITFAEEFTSNPSDCEKGLCTPIECEKGACDGWDGSYEINSNIRNLEGASRGLFYFKNNTEKTAFHIKTIINFKDFFGKQITRMIIKEEGPISTQFGKYFWVPEGTSKITYDMYWSEDYLPGTELPKKLE